MSFDARSGVVISGCSVVGRLKALLALGVVVDTAEVVVLGGCMKKLVSLVDVALNGTIGVECYGEVLAGDGVAFDFQGASGVDRG